MKIGIWNTAFLGDTLLTLPLIRNLKAYFPEAEIDFWVRKGYISLYAEQKDFFVHAYDKSKDGTIKGLKALGEKIRNRHYDIWINPHPSWRSSYIAYVAKAKESISYTIPWINKYIATKTYNRDPHKHEVYRLLGMVQHLGVSQELSLPAYTVSEQVSTQYKEYWKSFAKKHCSSTEIPRILALAIGSVWATKRWPVEYFTGLAHRAIENNFSVVLLGGGAEERCLGEQILHGIPQDMHTKIHNFIDASLLDTAGILSSSSVCCGNDTGLMHLAWLQNVPTVTLYGPTDPAQGFAPLSEGSCSLSVPVECRPCSKHGHKQCPRKHFRCMKELSIDKVAQTIFQMS